MLVPRKILENIILLPEQTSGLHMVISLSTHSLFFSSNLNNRLQYSIICSGDFNQSEALISANIKQLQSTSSAADLAAIKTI